MALFTVVEQMAVLEKNILSALKKGEWLMIKDVIAQAKLDVDRMYLSGFLDHMAESGLVEFEYVPPTAKRYRLKR